MTQLCWAGRSWTAPVLSLSGPWPAVHPSSHPITVGEQLFTLFSLFWAGWSWSSIIPIMNYSAGEKSPSAQWVCWCHHYRGNKSMLFTLFSGLDQFLLLNWVHEHNSGAHEDEWDRNVCCYCFSVTASLFWTGKIFMVTNSTWSEGVYVERLKPERCPFVNPPPDHYPMFHSKAADVSWGWELLSCTPAMWPAWPVQQLHSRNIT